MKQNLKRNIALTFRVDEDERDFIRKKMKIAGIDNIRMYLMHMAIHGKILSVDMSDVQECGRLLRNISNNVNQLAMRVNCGGNLYADDLADIQKRLSEVWEQQEKIIKSLTKIIEGVE